MPRSQAEARWAFANQDKNAYAREVVSEIHDRGPGSVKALPARVKDGKAVGKKKRRPFGSLAPVVAIIVCLSGHDARADCPADKPHQRQVIDLEVAQACKAKVIITLRCPKNAEKPCFYRARSACENPTPLQPVCLSDEELQKATAETE